MQTQHLFVIVVVIIIVVIYFSLFYLQNAIPKMSLFCMMIEEVRAASRLEIPDSESCFVVKVQFCDCFFGRTTRSPNVATCREEGRESLRLDDVIIEMA